MESRYLNSPILYKFPKNYGTYGLSRIHDTRSLTVLLKKKSQKKNDLEINYYFNFEHKRANKKITKTFFFLLLNLEFYSFRKIYK